MAYRARLAPKPAELPTWRPRSIRCGYTEDDQTKEGFEAMNAQYPECDFTARMEQASA